MTLQDQHLSIGPSTGVFLFSRLLSRKASGQEGIAEGISMTNFFSGVRRNGMTALVGRNVCDISPAFSFFSPLIASEILLIADEQADGHTVDH